MGYVSCRITNSTERAQRPHTPSNKMIGGGVTLIAGDASVGRDLGPLQANEES